jgi:hypothetical protein
MWGSSSFALLWLLIVTNFSNRITAKFVAFPVYEFEGYELLLESDYNHLALARQ